MYILFIGCVHRCVGRFDLLAIKKKYHMLYITPNESLLWEECFFIVSLSDRTLYVSVMLVHSFYLAFICWYQKLITGLRHVTPSSIDFFCRKRGNIQFDKYQIWKMNKTNKPIKWLLSISTEHTGYAQSAGNWEDLAQGLPYMALSNKSNTWTRLSLNHVLYESVLYFPSAADDVYLWWTRWVLWR